MKATKKLYVLQTVTKGREKLKTKVSTWGLPKVPKNLHWFYQTASAAGTKNCFGRLEVMKSLGKSASTSRSPGSISVDRVPCLA